MRPWRKRRWETESIQKAVLETMRWLPLYNTHNIVILHSTGRGANEEEETTVTTLVVRWACLLCHCMYVCVCEHSSGGYAGGVFKNLHHRWISRVTLNLTRHCLYWRLSILKCFKGHAVVCNVKKMHWLLIVKKKKVHKTPEQSDVTNEPTYLKVVWKRVCLLPLFVTSNLCLNSTYKHKVRWQDYAMFTVCRLITDWHCGSCWHK